MAARIKRAVILHGTLGSPEGNWFRWLESEFKSLGLEVWLPVLPGAEQPSLRAWADYVRDNCPFPLDDETVVVGHSSGAILALVVAQESPQPVGAVVAVSVFHDNSLDWEANSKLFDVTLDFADIKRNAYDFLFVHSDNDPYVPLPQAKWVADNCGSALKTIPGQGHFNTEYSEDYRRFPELLKLMRERQLL